MIVGHESAVRQLKAFLNPVTLLYGPKSVGKRTLAERLALWHKVKPFDYRFYSRLSVEHAREIRQFAATVPLSKFKLVVARIDGSSRESLNALLKLLEEPPPSIRFILIASQPTLPTVESRAAVFRLGYLSDAEVEKVLVEHLGWDQPNAAKVAPLAGGQIETARAAHELDVAKAPVVTLLKAASTGDRELLLNGLALLGNDQARLLERWATEARTANYKVFSPDDGYGLDNDVRSIDKLISIMQMGARPKIAAKLALLEIVEDRRVRA